VRILVTGATGRVGSRFVPRLLEQLGGGEHVRLLVRDAERAKELETRGAELLVGDLRDEASVHSAVEGADAIVHLGASFRGVPDDEAMAVNRQACVALARTALGAGARRFVFASTNLVYPGGAGRPAREDDELGAVPDRGSAYPASKIAAEAALHELHAGEGLGLRIVRLAFVYGDGDPHLGESLMWVRDWPIHKRLHLVHHADVDQALVRVLRAEGLDGGTWNIADDAPVTAYELLRLNGEPVPDEAADRPLDDPWEGIVDTTRMRGELGLRPIYPSVYAAKDAGVL
jgi:nucleoside-diphosphate-sugar epimerase